MDIEHLEAPQYEKIVFSKMDSKSVRFDIYVREKDATGQVISVYDVEMQTTSSRDLGKRTRYYASMADVSELASGKKYRDLPKSFIIFICTYDPFEQGRYIYHFEHRCLEDGNLNLQSRQHIVILNTKGNLNHADPELAAFLRYAENSTDEFSKASGSSFIRQIHREVCKCKANKEKEGVYMTLKDYVDDECSIAFEEGKAEGKAEGEAMLARSIALDMKQRRFPDDLIATLTKLPMDEVLALQPEQ